MAASEHLAEPAVLRALAAAAQAFGFNLVRAGNRQPVIQYAWRSRPLSTEATRFSEMLMNFDGGDRGNAANQQANANPLHHYDFFVQQNHAGNRRCNYS